MDTLIEVAATDTLGRHTGPRRMRAIEEKRRIVEETLQPGASVALIARRHEVNANLLFGWRRLYQRGLLVAEAPIDAAPLLPVTVTTPTLLPTSRVTRVKPGEVRRRRVASAGSIEIELAGGQRICVHGHVDPRALGRVLELLTRR